MWGHPWLEEKNYQEYMDIFYLCISHEVLDEITLLSGIWIGIFFHRLPRGCEGKNS